MHSYSLHRLTWAIFLCLLSSTFVSVEIAKGDDEHKASHLEDVQEETEAPPAPEESAAPEEATTADDGDDNDGGDEAPATEAAAPEEETAAAAESDAAADTTSESGQDSSSTAEATTCASAPACDVDSVTSTLSEKIQQLESKVETLVSQLTGELQSKVSELKDSIPESTCSSTDSAPASGNGNGNGHGNGKVQKSFDSCVEALSTGNLPEALQHWEAVEKQTFGPTAKATLLKDILFLAYDKSKTTVVNFVEDLLKSSKKFLPSVYDVLQEAMKLNSDNIFSLANTVKAQAGVDSHIYTQLPLSVRHITSGKTVTLTYLCKTLQKKLEVHVRDDEMTWEREYWPVVASNTYNLNHTKGAMWTFESLPNGNFHVKNSWFGDYLWIEPNYQNLRTVDESTKSRNGTEFKLTLNPDQTTITIHSVFYKDAPVVEGYLSRNTRDTFRPLRVDRDQTPIKFNMEIASKVAKK